MQKPQILAISANVTRPSKTFGLVHTIGQRLESLGQARVTHVDLVTVAAHLGATQWPQSAPEDVQKLLAAIQNADGLIVGSAVYKGAYTGLFKHLFDLIDPNALTGKPVILSATGGSERHALVIDHLLRPLFSFFGTATISTGIYATDTAFTGEDVTDLALFKRIDRAVAEFQAHLAVSQPSSILAKSA